MPGKNIPIIIFSMDDIKNINSMTEDLKSFLRFESYGKAKSIESAPLHSEDLTINVHEKLTQKIASLVEYLKGILGDVDLESTLENVRSTNSFESPSTRILLFLANLKGYLTDFTTNVKDRSFPDESLYRELYGDLYQYLNSHDVDILKQEGGCFVVPRLDDGVDDGRNQRRSPSIPIPRGETSSPYSSRSSSRSLFSNIPQEVLEEGSEQELIFPMEEDRSVNDAITYPGGMW